MSLAALSALTLKPKIVAFEVTAKCASFSEIPPTLEATILMPTSSVSNLFSEDVIASSEPLTSAFNTRLNTFFSPDPMLENMLSNMPDCCLDNWLSL